MKKNDIKNVLIALMDQLSIAILIAVCIGLGAYVWVDAEYVPNYRSESLIAVSNRETIGNTGNLNETVKLAEKVDTVLKSNVIKKQLRNEVKTGFNLNSGILAGTNLVQIDMSASSPEGAFTTLSYLLDNYQQLAGETMSNIHFEVLEQPLVPTNPTETNTAIKIALIAAGVGFVASCGVLIVYLYLRDTVKTEEDVDTKLMAPRIGMIYHERDRGKLQWGRRSRGNRLLITNPARSTRFVEGIRMLANTLTEGMEANHKSLLVTSTFENEGKSTLTANLALALADGGYRVLLVDGDMRRPSLATLLNIKELNNQVQDREQLVMKSDIRQIQDNLDGLLWNAKTSIKPTEAQMVQFADFLREMKQQYDYVIVDTAPSWLVSDTTLMCDMVDYTILIVKRDYMLAKDINDIIDGLEHSDSELLGVVMNDILPESGDIPKVYGYQGNLGEA